MGDGSEDEISHRCRGGSVEGEEWGRLLGSVAHRERGVGIVFGVWYQLSRCSDEFDASNPGSAGKSLGKD